MVTEHKTNTKLIAPVSPIPRILHKTTASDSKNRVHFSNHWMRWLTVQNYPWKRPLSLWALGHPPPLFPGLTTGTASHIPNASDCRACCSIQISGDNDDDEHRLTLDPAFYVHHKLRKQRTVWSTYSAASLPPQHFTAVKNKTKTFWATQSGSNTSPTLVARAKLAG